MSEASDDTGVSDADFSKWKSEATARGGPTLNDWAHLVADLRVAGQIDSRTDMEAAVAALASAEHAARSIVLFLQRQTYLPREAIAPMQRLASALWDLKDGKLHPMLKPDCAAGAPGNSSAIEAIKGLAARALSELHASGISLPEAAQQVAHALQQASTRDRAMNGAKLKGLSNITANTVKNWRARIMEGPGPGVSEDAIEHFKAPLPPSMGATPAERGRNLLQALHQNAAVQI